MDGTSSEKEKQSTFQSFSLCFRYIDDLLCINNHGRLSKLIHDIYPRQLELTSDGATTKTNYLDLAIKIQSNKMVYSLFDKRDAFSFKIVNFPDLSGNIPKKQSYGVFTSQLIRYARCCQFFSDFEKRTKALVLRLKSQNFKLTTLKRTFEKFIFSYPSLIDKYIIDKN